MDAARDAEGYLVDIADWNESEAHHSAQALNIALNKDHWTLIHLVRKFYQDYDTNPNMRVFIKLLRDNGYEHLANSITVMTLMGESPMRTTCKLAGLPKPTNCL